MTCPYAMEKPGMSWGHVEIAQKTVLKCLNDSFSSLQAGGVV